MRQQDSKLHYLLGKQGLNQSILAERIGSLPSHVNQVLLNKPGRGHTTRPKLAAHLDAETLAHLGWNKDGSLVSPVSRGTSHVEYVEPGTYRVTVASKSKFFISSSQPVVFEREEVGA